jgi:hypothetical protein
MPSSEPTPTLDDLAWVIWNLEVRDPDRLVPPGIGERTKQAMTELALQLGCVFQYCVDDDSYLGYGRPEDDLPYYQWVIRVPREQHHHRGEDGIPHAIGEVGRWLRTQLPAALRDWIIAPDENESWQEAFAELLRDSYDDLLDAVEVALLGMRSGGAERFDPGVKCWAVHEGVFAGSYHMLLGRDPDGGAHPPWLVLYVGHVPAPGFWDSPAGTRMARFAYRDHPVLVLPSHTDPTWWVSLATAPFRPQTPWSDNQVGQSRVPTATGARYQWTGPDPEELAGRVARDLSRLFPHLAGG